MILLQFIIKKYHCSNIQFNDEYFRLEDFVRMFQTVFKSHLKTDFLIFSKLESWAQASFFLREFYRLGVYFIKGLHLFLHC